MILSQAFTVLALLLSIANAASNSNSKTPPVSVKGNAFFANNKRFYIRGIDYQPGGDSKLADPLADTTGCKRDIEKFKQLGLNTIRVYTVDNTANHDDCMKALADAGIYVALDVNSPQYSLNRENPYTIWRSYNDVYLQNVFSTVDSFAKYDNTLLFFSANEVINTIETSFAAPYIKAVTRDIKSYLKARNYRQIPVGYSAADFSDNRYEQATFMNCGGDDARGDFFAFNDYSYCNSDFTTSGWDKKVEQYKSYSIPFFLSEFGCNKNRPRQFKEIADLYSSKMTSVYSGGIVYEYSQEANNYGVVNLKGGQAEERDEFSILRDAFKKTPAPSDDGGYSASGQPSECPPTNTQSWKVSNNTVPSMPDGAKKFMKDGAGTGPGLKTGDNGSQWAGNPSGSWEQPGSTGSSSSSNKGKSSGTMQSIPGLTLLALGIVAQTLM